MKFHMYISISGEDRISFYEVEAESGNINLLGDVNVAGRPAPLAISPDTNYLYAGCREDFGITSYRIDQVTGGITPIGKVPLNSDPCFMSVDKTGNYLFSAYYKAGGVAVHSIGESGQVDALPIACLKTGTGAHSIRTDPSNRFAFVPHIAENGPNRIFQFRFDETNGTISHNSPLTVDPGVNSGPRHYCFHPGKDIVYFSNEQGCSVSGYHLDISSGTLSHFQTVSTLPLGYSRSNTCSQIQISPSGKYLYAPNRGHNSVACFAVDESDGTLRAIGWADADPVPRAFSLDPHGGFLFAAGLESGTLCTYRIDEMTGQPYQISTHVVGKEPMWVLTTELTGRG